MRKITEKKLDTAYSQFIRERDGKCKRCGSTSRLETAHYHSRVARTVRYHPHNAIALCHECHALLEHRKKTDHRFLMVKIFGESAVAEVDRLYHTTRQGGLTEGQKSELLDLFSTKNIIQQTASRRDDAPTSHD